MYNPNSLFVIGDAKSSQNNPITKQYNQFFLALVIDVTNDEIIDSECSSTLQLTNQFVHGLLTGCTVHDESIEGEIRGRYHGASQKALIVAFRDAKNKYEQAKAALTT